MTRKHYFDRADKDEMLRCILSFPDGKELLNNVINALHYNWNITRTGFIESGFRYIERTENDTIEKILDIIENHFGFTSNNKEDVS